MTADVFKDIEKLEADLWEAADNLRRRALWLPENARYDWIMKQAAVSGSDLPRLVTDVKRHAILTHCTTRPDTSRPTGSPCVYMLDVKKVCTAP